MDELNLHPPLTVGKLIEALENWPKTMPLTVSWECPLDEDEDGMITLAPLRSEDADIESEEDFLQLMVVTDG
jgi:hypothetical protein